MDLHRCLQTLGTFGPFEDFGEVTLGLLDFLTQPPILPPEQDFPASNLVMNKDTYRIRTKGGIPTSSRFQASALNDC